ncbi:MAG: phosphonoacetaldehyde reductase [Oscillospiraceae bacterium]|nr:phosphonoacetaldehyde reductase [Oscillospiraceae bacterium]
MQQVIYKGRHAALHLVEVLRRTGCKRMMLVCGSSFRRLSIRADIDALEAELVPFSDFSPNPLYEDVCKGVALFRSRKCQAILAVGGGSAMDVAKCIKLFGGMPPGTDYLDEPFSDSGIPLIAVPTTAGTGSESTRFAVIYRDGEKQSVQHDSILPDYVVLDGSVLYGLPDYQKKCTMLDALCQAIESMWSVHSVDASRVCASAAIGTILTRWEDYLNGDADAAEDMLSAANLAGQAINVTQTTAPHAMSYKLTSLYGLPHGHAVAVCLPEVWDYMLHHPDPCADPRGRYHVAENFRHIAAAMGCETAEQAVALFRKMLMKMEISGPAPRELEKELDILAGSVNPERMKNNPVLLSTQVCRAIYGRILKGEN